MAMLEPLAGRDNVRATVNVSYDEGSEERTDEVYDPSQVAALTMQKSDQSAAQAAQAQGVPGTASNSPAGCAGGCGGGIAGGCVRRELRRCCRRRALPVYPQNGGAGQTTA